MTFKQLIDKYSFEEIIPELNELWDKGNYIYIARHLQFYAHCSRRPVRARL